MGFSLTDNFDTPYFSGSIQEFWRRWHISLSTWFKDYLYIPLGGNRCGRLRRHWNILVTFLVSGLWHGASWHFVVWGGLHGVFQIIAAETGPYRDMLYERTHTKCTSFSFRFGQVAATFVLTTFAWIFFRARSLTQACGYIGRIFTKPDWHVLTDGSLCQLGLNRVETNVLLVSLWVLFGAGLVKYRKKETPDLFLDRQCAWFRWAAVAGMFAFIFLFGVYGPGFDAGQFIYFQF